MSFKYDFLITGAGFSGAIFAYEASKLGKKCLVIDKRNHIGGNCYTENVYDINIHKYGPHLFNTNSYDIWNYVNSFVPFISYQHKIKVCYRGEFYSFPINLNTLYELFGYKTPEEAKQLQVEKIDNPKNLEEFALSQVGRELYEIFIKGFTEKQWGKPCVELPSNIVKRIPIRYNWNDHYHDSKFCGIPIGGYTRIFEKLLDNIEVKLNTSLEKDWRRYAKKLVYSGPIDELLDYKHGPLEYRSLRFETKTLDICDYQGIGQINYTEKEIPYTRIIEHKHFDGTTSKKTVVTWEYPEKWELGKEPYYPVDDNKNNEIYKMYKKEIPDDISVLGRMGSFKYLNMDACISMALKLVKDEITKK